MPEVENTQYQTTKLGSQFKIRLINSIINGLIPMFLYLTWKFGRIEQKSRRILSGLIITPFIAIAILIRQQLIKSSIVTLANLKSETGENIYNVINMENLNFEYYLLGGVVIGCVVSYFSLRNNARDYR